MSEFDLATLKIEVDTTDLATATSELTKFADASKKLSATEIANEKLALAQRKQLLAEQKHALAEHNAAERASKKESKRIRDEDSANAAASEKAKLALQINSGLMTNRATEQAAAANLAIQKKHRDFVLADEKKSASLSEAISRQHGETLLQQWRSRGALANAIHKQHGEILMMEQIGRWKREELLNKAHGQALVEDAKRTAKQIADAQAAPYGISSGGYRLTESALRAAQMAKPVSAPETDIYTAAGIKSPTQRVSEIRAVETALKSLRAEHGLSGIEAAVHAQSIKELEGRWNLLTHGNSRHRSAIRQTAAAMASLTFEMTGAIYGLTALAAAMAAPGIVGIKLQKSMEDAQAAITGILISMGRIGGKQIEVNQGWQIAGSYIKEVHKDAMRLGIDMDKLVNVNRAIMAPGLAAGLQLEQIKTIAMEGAVAVSMIGLNSQQYVQEIRDLVAGGIQPASSTLATALGITDKILKDWKAQGPDVFFNKLHDAIGGFAKAAEELRKSTLSGAWEIMMANFRNLMVDPEAFKGLVGAINQVSDAIASPKFKDIIGQYWTALKGISSALWEIVKVAAILAPILIKIGEAMAVAWIGGKVIAGIKAVVSGIGAAITAVNIMASGVAALTSGMTLYGTAATAAGIATTGMKAAMTSIWVKAGTFGKYGIVGLALWGLYEIADMTGFIDRIFNNVNVKLEGYKKKISEMSLDAARIEQSAATAEYEKVKASYQKDRSTGMGMSWGGAADVDAALKNKRAIDAKVEQLERQHQVTVLAAMKDSTEEWNALNMTKTQQLEKEIKKQNDAYLKQSAFIMENGKTDEERQKSQIALAQDYAVKMDVLMGKQKASKAIKIELTEQEKIDIQIQKDIIAEYERKVKQMDSNNDALAKSNDALRIHNSEIGKTKEEIANLAIERENHAIKMDEESLAVLDATLVCSAESEALRENIKLRKERRELSGQTAILEADKAATDAALKAAKDAIAEEQRAQESKWKMIDGFAHDAFNNILDKGENVFKSIGDAIKKYLLDMLYKMTVQKWLINVGVLGGTTAAGNAMAMGGGIGGAAGGGGIGSWLNIGSTLNNAYGAFTTGLSQSVAQVGATMWEAGAETIGNAIMGNIAPITTALSYVGAGLAGITLGTAIAGDKKFMGMSGSTTSTIGAVGGGILGSMGMLGALGGPLGALAGGVVGGILNAAFGRGPVQQGTTTLAGQFSQQGFAGQYQTPWSQSGGWFTSGRSGVNYQGLGSEQQTALTSVVAGTKSVFDNLVFVAGNAMKSIDGWSFAINRQVANQEQQNQLIIDMATSMGNYMIPSLAAFQKEGENLADTAVRMKDTFILTDAILNMVGGTFGEVGLASMKMRDNLVNLLGGLQQANTAMQSYYNNFYSDEERVMNAWEQMSVMLRSMGVDIIPTTNDAFRALVESQDLSTVSGQESFAALIGLADTFNALTSSTTELTAQSEQLLNNLSLLTEDSFRTLVDYTRYLRKSEQGISGGGAISGQVSDIIANAPAASVKAVEQFIATPISTQDTYSASNPNPTLVAARDAAIAKYEALLDDYWLAEVSSRNAGYRNAERQLTIAKAMPTFASGGIHSGGWRMVGENGPEIEYTPPSRIFNNSQSRGMMAANDDTANEIKQLRAELQAIGLALAKNTGEAAKILRRFDGDGMPAERVIAS